MTQETVEVYVEIPKGSRNKYEYEVETGRLVLDRMLFTAMQYPADYGFIEGTLAEDGDPLDAMVLVGEPTFPGCTIRARPIALFRMRDEKGADEKVLCVPLRDPQWSELRDLEDIPEALRNEIDHFFRVYKDLEEGETQVEGWEDREAALGAVRQGRGRAQSRKG